MTIVNKRECSTTVSNYGEIVFHTSAILTIVFRDPGYIYGKD